MPTITAANGDKIVEATADLTTDGYIGIPISLTVFYDTAKNRGETAIFSCVSESVLRK